MIVGSAKDLALYASLIQKKQRKLSNHLMELLSKEGLSMWFAQSTEERSKSLQMTQHPPQSLFTSNWDVLAPLFFLPPLLPTPIPASHIKSSLPNRNQYLGNYEGASYTLGAHNYQGNYSTYPGHAVNITGVRLEMNDIQKVLKSPNSLAVQVGNAVKVREVYSLSSADGRVGQAKSARWLRY